MTQTLATHQLRARLEDLGPAARAELVERLRRAQPTTRTPSSSWFVRAGSGEPSLRLFCFSFAGSGASVFRSWSEHLPDGVEVCAVQLPGRETRVAEAPYQRMGPLVADLHAAIEGLLDRPFALFGHSMGALVAFELARRLRIVGAPQPRQLFVSAFRAPQLPNPNIRIFHLPDEVLKTVLLKDGTPLDVVRNDELIKAILPTLRADFEVCETYDYTAAPALTMPISVFGGLQDIRVRQPDLAQWEMQAGADFSLTMLPGGHFFINSAQVALLEQLSRELHRQIPREVNLA